MNITFKNFSTFFILFLYFGVNAFLYLNNASVPDEIWFFNDAVGFSKLSWKEIFNVGNHLGYGQLYWFIHILVVKFSSIFNVYTILPIKIVYFLVKILEILFLYLLIKQLNGDKDDTQIKFLLILILCISLPMNWFQGKITSVDMLLPSITFILTYFIVTKRLKLAFFLFGVGVGLKLNFLAIFPFIYAFAYYKSYHDFNYIENLKKLFIAISIIVFGFIISNPIIVVDYNSFIHNLPQSGMLLGIETVYQKLNTIFFSSEWLWEIVPIGSFHYFFSIWVLVAIILMLFLQNKKIFIFLMISIISMSILLIVSKSYFGWYWFPIFSIVLISVIFLNNKQIVFLIIVSLFVNTKNIAEQINIKIQHIDNINNALVYNLYLRHLITDKTDFLIDYSEFGYKDIDLDGRLQNIGIMDERKLSSLDFIWNYYLRYTRNDKNEIILSQLSQYNEIILVVGDRVRKNRGGRV